MPKTRAKEDLLIVQELRIVRKLVYMGEELELTADQFNAIAGVVPGTGAASKALVLDANGNLVMPANGQFEFSNAVAAAAGSTAADATVLAAQANIVTGADAVKGVALPAAVDGLAIYILNAGSAALKVYPVNGGNDNINALSEDAAFTMGPGQGAWFTCSSATQWYVPDTAALAVVSGVAGGYKVARSGAPVALGGGNPTSVAHGLTTCLAVFVQLVGSAAPGVGTSVLTAVINGANIDVYAFKVTSNADPTLIASTGVETFNWFAIGT